MNADVIISWNEATQQWRMCWADTGKFINEFYDCPSFEPAFKGISKERPALCNIKTQFIKLLEKEPNNGAR